jgi:putative transposase
MSSYHYDPKITRAQKEELDADIIGKIEQIRVTFPQAGYRSRLHYLKRSGIEIRETKLKRIIKKFGLQVKRKRKFVTTTQSNHDCLVYPNLIQATSS